MKNERNVDAKDYNNKWNEQVKLIFSESFVAGYSIVNFSLNHLVVMLNSFQHLYLKQQIPKQVRNDVLELIH